MAYEFLSLQGKASLARNIDGKTAVLTELGNLTDLTLGIATAVSYTHLTLPTRDLV